jgi:hypothetical protein
MTLDITDAFDTIVECYSFQVRMLKVHNSFEFWLLMKQTADISTHEVE